MTASLDDPELERKSRLDRQHDSHHDTHPAIRRHTEVDKEHMESDLPQIRELRHRRGSQEVSFDQIADHLVDYAASHPDMRDFVDRLAGFLARVERVPHDHDVPGGTTPL